MSQRREVNDLIVLVADKNMEFSIKGILENHHRLGIRALPEEKRKTLQGAQDAGTFRRCADFLRPYTKDYKFALVMIDREGSGQEGYSRIEIEKNIEERLAGSGWDDRAKAVVFDPELEIWVWSDSPKVDEVLEWGTRQPTMRDWLKENGWLVADEIKPKRPKEALAAVLKLLRKPWSSSIHLSLAQQVSFQRCTDASFIKLKTLLQEWFPQELVEK